MTTVLEAIVQDHEYSSQVPAKRFAGHRAGPCLGSQRVRRLVLTAARAKAEISASFTPESGSCIGLDRDIG